MDAIASLITSLTIVYSTVYWDADQRKHQSSASLAFVWGIHWGPVNSPHKWPVTHKMFPFDDVIVYLILFSNSVESQLMLQNTIMLWEYVVTHCSLVTPYGDRDLGQQWLRLWLVAWRHQAITWTNVDWSSVKSSDIHIRAISQEMPQSSISKIHLKITYIKFY